MANSTVNKTDGQSLNGAEVMDIVNATNSKQDKEAGKGLSDVNFTTTKDTKLTGIATGATANAADSALRDRATHTGTQSADTLTDGTTNKAFLATERTKLAGITTGATVNDTDANLKARANHTGVQAISTITGLQAALDAKLTNAPVVQVHTTGSTLTLADATTRAVINPATTLSTVNAILAASPYDGQRQAIYVGGTITSGTVVSTLTVTASQGIVQAPAFTPTDGQYGDTYTFEYLASTSKWYLL